MGLIPNGRNNWKPEQDNRKHYKAEYSCFYCMTLIPSNNQTCTWPKKNCILNLCMFPETERNYFFSVPFMRHLNKWVTGATCLEHTVLRIFL